MFGGKTRKRSRRAHAKKHTAKKRKHTAKKHHAKKHTAKKHRKRSKYQIHMKTELHRLRKLHPGKEMKVLFKMAVGSWKAKK